MIHNEYTHPKFPDFVYEETDANDAQIGRTVVLPESGEIGAIIEILLGTEPVMASIKLIDGTEITHEFDTLLEADAEQDKRYYSIHEWIY